MGKHAKIAVIVATVNRVDHLSNLINSLSEQSVRPSRVLVSAPTTEDLSQNLADYGGWVETVVGAKGLSVQRNAALEKLDVSFDYVFFFDDDTLPRSDYIETAMSAFDAHPEAVGVTGSVILDGAARGYPVSFGEARSALKSSWREYTPLQVVDVRSLYGCNFAVRYSAAAGLLFDDQLPLYSWLEDLDYSRRLAHRGRLMRCEQCVAVHHGSASGGRTQHVRFGYSQITNPVHLWKKGSISSLHTCILIFKPFTKNLLESGFGGNKTWRRGRLWGNFLSLLDLMRGRVSPGRIVEF